MTEKMIDFRLPDGRVVGILAELAKDRLSIDFTLETGVVVMAQRVADVCVFYCVGAPSSFTWRKSIPYRDAREASIALATVRNMNYPAFIERASADVPTVYDDARSNAPLPCFICGISAGSYGQPFCFEYHPIFGDLR